MTKGLCCPNCDTTIHRKTVHEWIVNKKAPYLNCTNAFCNTRWKRSVLEERLSTFTGEVKAKAPKKKKKPAEAPVAAKAMSAADIPVRRKKTYPRVRRPAMRKDQSWLDRIRQVAIQFATINGAVSVDDLRVWADENHMQPPYSSSWGAVFQSTVWKKVSQKNSSYSKSRSRKISVWALRSKVLATV